MVLAANRPRPVSHAADVPPGPAGATTDRIIDPDETVARMKRFQTALGITRLADQTGLDRIGIPCVAAFRPNALTLATNQGKGPTLAAARASAMMEAAEFAVAERPAVRIRNASAAEMASAGLTTTPIDHLLPFGERLDPSLPLGWAPGIDLASGREVHAPLEALDIDPGHRAISGLIKSTNGLASGNIELEALFHGLCELVERDAETLWSLRSPDDRACTCLLPGDFDNPAVIALAGRIRAADLRLTLYDLTADNGIPCVMAVIGERGGAGKDYFTMAAGYGAHPVAARAALRAITEAAQTRITSIAGARDDIDPGTYTRVIGATEASLLDMRPARGRTIPAGLANTSSLNDMFAWILRRLRETDVSDIHAYRLSEPDLGFSVVKLLCHDLEDRAANPNWRPRARALKVLMGS